MEINNKMLLGTWSVHEVTKLLSSKDLESINNEMDLLDSGKTDIEKFLGSKVTLPHAITVEILDSGIMTMYIIQSMRPNIPAVMYIKAFIKLEISGSEMITTPITEKLDVKVVIDSEHGLSPESFTELKNKICDIESSTLNEMKKDPLWTSANIVEFIYCNRQYFLTKSKNNVFMLHHKI